MPAAGEATTTIVKPDGTGDFPTIQAAIDAALEGDIIELTDGTFTGDGNRDMDYLGKAITVRSQGGNPETCLIDCEGSQSEPHGAIEFSGGEGASSILEGITIRGAYPAGIICDSSSPTLYNCRFRDNLGSALGLNHSQSSIIGCQFLNNASDFGGAGINWANSSGSITDCVFEENTALVGAGLFCQWASPTISGCSFVGNAATLTGGAIAGQSSSSHVSNCSFSSNTAGEAGGAIRFHYDAPILEDLVCEGNSAGEVGGAMSIEDVEGSIVRRCVLRENSAPAGAGLHGAGEITVDQCAFVGNAAGQYGGGMISDGPVVVTACTFVGNAAPGGGSGVWGGGENALSMEKTQIVFGEQGAAVRCPSSIELVCCDIYGNADGDWVGCIEDQYGVNGNISEDPLFCDPENGDFAIRSDSPCAPFSPPNEECDLIGAFPVGCNPPSATMLTTWGKIKATYN
ncbi:MAG: right-handed parallel beta-helix repeat-containing protein [Candidatus Eisenbacteria bacterium]|uniref:Right-handed parallel beta-helix repeat-containing protein n=1 Tax=Eiseniibacteriota bacterium TaxID=2212470 RepID=A0A948RVL5_UNCEI|nr:right-handed parallel beta-helix repeat-containing protein [Candidatus Eisenbacteria bacterium]